MTEPAETESVFETWSPVTRDFGLIDASVDAVAEASIAWRKATFGAQNVDVTRSDGPLAARFAALAPLCIAKNRTLLLQTTAGWTAHFANGISGSDPASAMPHLVRTLGVRAMRICVAPATARYRGVIWEVYDPNDSQDTAGVTRRSIAAANDGGRWVFETFGTPFPFEQVRKYNAPRKRDRFDLDLLQSYLTAFGITDWGDALLSPKGDPPGCIISVPPWEGAKLFTLDEVRAGVPWQK
ncbi:hypothetical protein [Sulfitobacter aestuariivivens]|uniref:Uncharacterized protein n=1 Tax=Sulfitobacter aestuariivivens TaxID=2766981 RepID=A0A927D2G2_9RHOB|nr:hypothetical protein [Sulfitobacter aestuariivivens]MBD3663858.1 hypothetical protein [Sulfitobacter aestuariivivens]